MSEELVKDIVSMNISHDASVCYLHEGKVQWMIEEERLTHKKYDAMPFLSIAALKDRVPNTSTALFSLLRIPGKESFQQYDIDYCLSVYRKSIRCSLQDFKWKGMIEYHHLSHASVGFYNSGFDEAVVVVVDGAGAVVNEEGHEVESIYRASYPDNFELLHQKLCPLFNSENISSDHTYGIGMTYAAVSDYLGFDFHGSGKTMGLAPYGKDSPKIKSFLKEDGSVDNSRFERVQNGVAIMGDANYDDESDLAYRVQKDFETYMINLLNKAIELSGSKNIVLSGGCALNCVANYKYLEHLPEGTNLFVEPICYDAGIALGQAMLVWRNITRSMEKFPLENLYLGPPQKHDIPEDTYEVSTSDVVDIIIQGNPVAIFQGRSEQGPRALGNRSLLFDPRVPNAQEILNKKKGRELWRPFAASVLLDHVHDWFDMRGLKESPYMMFAVNAREEVWNEIPGVLHVDKTCRIQTVSREQNPNYYDLIREFYDRTGVPMLLNTSFNLAGDTICETVKDAVDTIKRSELEYVYFAECGRMLNDPNRRS